MIPLTITIKLFCAGVLALIMVTASPSVIRLWLEKPPVPTIQATIPERVSSTEARIANLEHRQDELESAKIAERLSAIEARQGTVLLFLAPMALFVFTHTYELVQRIRGKSMTRATDPVPHKRKKDE